MARIPGVNVNADNLNSATISRWMARNYTPNFASNHPVWFLLMKMGHVVEGHGYSFNYPFRYPSPVGPKLIGISDGFALLPPPVEMGGFSMFQFTPAMFGMSVAIEIYDDMAQGGETTRIPYYESRMEQAVDIQAETLNLQSWALEGASGSGGDRPDVLSSWRTLFNGGGTSSTAGGVPDAKPAQKTAAYGSTPVTKVGGVERNGPQGYYQCPNLYTYASLSNQTETFSLQTLSRMYLNTVRNNKHANCIIVPERIYAYVDNALNALQRWTNNADSDLARVGFNSIKYKDADVIMDEGCPSIDYGNTYNHIFMINLDHVFLNVNTLKPKFMPVTDPTRAIKLYQSYQMMQLCVDDTGREHARHTAIAATNL